jgi:predicted GIY-YIG superfamily endonuclease
MTSDLNRRLEEHRVGTKGFASSYKMTKLVYYETLEGPNVGLQRERILKMLRREKKIQLA